MSFNFPMPLTSHFLVGCVVGDKAAAAHAQREGALAGTSGIATSSATSEIMSDTCLPAASRAPRCACSFKTPGMPWRVCGLCSISAQGLLWSSRVLKTRAHRALPRPPLGLGLFLSFFLVLLLFFSFSLSLSRCRCCSLPEQAVGGDGDVIAAAVSAATTAPRSKPMFISARAPARRRPQRREPAAAATATATATAATATAHHAPAPKPAAPPRRPRLQRRLFSSAGWAAAARCGEWSETRDTIRLDGGGKAPGLHACTLVT